MILVRNIFQLKFGKAREAVELMREMVKRSAKDGFGPIRVLTDLTGPYYTLVMEVSHQSLSEFESMMKQMSSNPDQAAWYQKFVTLVESGQREIFTVVQ